ncbi:UNVERIFIED_CONTAM: High affinity cAMP-specific and IBMX-insensitive 3',5'-cyclic phosphodiesterase 9A, partial [Siphonaria sp. JEL0065]
TDLGGKKDAQSSVSPYLLPQPGSSGSVNATTTTASTTLPSLVSSTQAKTSTSSTSITQSQQQPPKKKNLSEREQRVLEDTAQIYLQTLLPTVKSRTVTPFQQHQPVPPTTPSSKQSSLESLATQQQQHRRISIAQRRKSLAHRRPSTTVPPFFPETTAAATTRTSKESLLSPKQSLKPIPAITTAKATTATVSTSTTNINTMSSQPQSTTVHIRIENPTSQPRTETIDIPPSCTLEEIKSVFYAAAELPEDSGVVLKLTDSEGAIVPIGHGLDGNTKDTPYVLKVIGDNLMNFGLMQSALNEVSSSAQQASPSDVQDLKNGIIALKKKLDEMEAGITSRETSKESSSLSAPPASPVPRRKSLAAPVALEPVSRPTRKPIVLNSHYTQKPKYILTEETKEYIRSPSFDNWAWDENELFGLFEFIFEDLGLISEFKIEVTTLRKFLVAVRDSYNNNPFHNFKHCFCVSQMMFGILNTSKVVEKLKPIDKLVLLLSTIGHDLDHPGFSNTYQINAATDLAIIYNDISPLENHHSAVLFTLLSHPETNVLENISDAVYREARKNIIRCILATDMAKHGEIMAAFKKASEAFNYDDAEHKSLLLQIIVKCSDISNEVRPTEVAEPWVEALLNEFFAQSDTEKAQGLPTAPFMDRDKVTKAGAQVGFIGYVMIPLYELASKVLPNMDEAIIKPIRDSLIYYKDMLEKTKA